MKDEFGDRMKSYEMVETNSTYSKDLPMIVRFDGRGFSKYTKGFDRPFDSRISMCMQYAAKKVMQNTNALCYYTQSDEITLVYPRILNPIGEREFIGRKHKLLSNYTSMITAYFNQYMWTVADYNKSKVATFDARIFNVPTDIEAANSVLWRIHDARRNSVSMVYHYHYGHKKMQGKSSQEMKDELGELYSDIDQKYRLGIFETKDNLVDIEEFLTYDIAKKVTTIFGEDNDQDQQY